MKKRIALISEHASPLAMLGGVDSGGQNVYVGEIAKNLTVFGYEVDVFTRRDSELLPEAAEWVNGVRIIHVPAGVPEYLRKEDLLPFMADFTSYMVNFCQQEGQMYDLIHANFWMSGLVAANIKKVLGIPFVITFHALGKVRRFYQGDADQFPNQRFAIEERIINEADRIIAECPQEEEDLIRFYNADPAKITIIPGGFDPGQFWPIGKVLARVALGLDPNEKVILQLGRMVPRKGVDAVIYGFAQLLKTSDFSGKLLIVGGESDDPDPNVTPEIGRLKAIAQSENIEEKVTFVGRRGREALKLYYSAADLFITTPWYEPFGITPVEAMACGTPVIGSNVGGIKFTVRDGETGYLVPANNPSAIAERIAYLYQHPKLMNVLRQQAIQRANDLFTWQRVTDSIADLYEKVIAKNSPTFHQVSWQEIVDRGFNNAITAIQKSRRSLRNSIIHVADIISNCFSQNGKVLICGNGGSAAEAQHFAAEFVGHFKCKTRPGLPALALNADTAVLTAWSNDVGYENAFSRQVEAFGRAGDVLIGISTSGNSRNIIKAFETAKKQGLNCIGILGKDGGDLHLLADISIIVPENDTQHIQEVQIVVIHLICELVEEKMMLVENSISEVIKSSEFQIPTTHYQLPITH
ncbi:glycosyltransferase [Floridanema evergladense]|uniref:Phosphoheptose isomerase n=1 Tax=Floridaenema evergladense BLCC-F167 TaxID=3153639 RepID=A0ABV4WJ39_9CYAN